MFSHPQFQYIAIASINTSPSWTLHPFLDIPPGPVLIQSFEESGILHPPIVQQTDNGSFNLICGQRRLYAARHYFRQVSLACLVIQSALPPSAFFLFILTDQQTNGLLSPMEAAFFLHYCLDKMEEKQIAELFLPRLGYKKQTALIHKLTRLTALEQIIQQHIHAGLISDKTAFELLTLSPEDRLSLALLFDYLQLGSGKQNRLLMLSRDLALRSHTTISSLLKQQEFLEVLTHQEMNVPQKSHLILELLQKQVYGRSIDAELEFKEKVKKLQLPGNYEITHSLNFEKDEVYLTETFPDWESCQKHVARNSSK